MREDSVPLAYVRDSSKLERKHLNESGEVVLKQTNSKKFINTNLTKTLLLDHDDQTPLHHTIHTSKIVPMKQKESKVEMQM